MKLLHTIILLAHLAVVAAPADWPAVVAVADAVQAAKQNSFPDLPHDLPPPDIVVAPVIEPEVAIASERKRRILYFQAEWCQACKPITNVELPALKRVGWEIGDLPSNHIQVIEPTQTSILQKWNVTAFPTCVLIEDGVEKGARLPNDNEKRIDRWSISALYKGKDERPRPVSATANVMNFTDDHWSGGPQTRGKLISHLLRGSVHRGRYSKSYLAGLDFGTLLQLHARDHQ